MSTITESNHEGSVDTGAPEPSEVGATLCVAKFKRGKWTIAPLVIWSTSIIPMVGDTLFLDDMLPVSERGWYKVTKRQWKTILERPKAGETARLYAAFLQIVIEKDDGH